MLRLRAQASAIDKNFFLIEKTSIHFIIHCYTKQNKGFQQYPFTFFDSLYHNPAFRVVGKAGGEGDAVVGGGLEIAPIGVGNDSYRLHRIGTGAVDRGVGNGIALLQILDGPDHILSAPVVAAHGYISIPGGGGAVVPQALFHALGVSPSQTFMLMFREGIFTVPIWPSL